MDSNDQPPVAAPSAAPDASGMGHLWAIVQAHLDRWGVLEAELARRIGTKPQTLNSWKNRGVRALPRRQLLLNLATVTRVPYQHVLEAALMDAGYLTEESDGDDSAAPTSTVTDLSEALGKVAGEPLQRVAKRPKTKG